MATCLIGAMLVWKCSDGYATVGLVAACEAPPSEAMRPPDQRPCSCITQVCDSFNGKYGLMAGNTTTTLDAEAALGCMQVGVLVCSACLDPW